MDFFDFDRDGDVDGFDLMMHEEMMCTSREEHEALFGDSGDWGDEEDEEDELEDALDMAGLDRFDLEMMDEDERREALEDAGLDPDDYDFF